MKLYLSVVTSIVPASMSGETVPGTSATYAVVDFAKMKKNKNVCVPEEVQESDSDIPLYAVGEKTKTSIAAPEKLLEHTHDTTDLANNEISMCEEPAPSSTSCLPVEYSPQDKDKSKYEGSARARRLVCLALVVVVALVLVAAVFTCLVITFVKVSTLMSEIKSLQQHTQQINVTSMKRSDTFTSMLQSLSMLFKASLSQVNHTLLNLSLLQENNAQELYNLLTGQLITFPAASCASVLLFAPSMPSGYYWINSSNGSAVRVYCDMTRSCGNITRGWMRVAELDMTDTAIQCPSNLTLRSDGNSRTCIPKTMEAACTSVYYPTHTPYSHVCGMIKADTVATADGFQIHGQRPMATTNDNVSTNYVDGVSVTHGKKPRLHIWTMAFLRVSVACSCETNRPSFVASDFFCCGNHCTMCNPPPWFYKQLPVTPTNDDIEMRVCRDQDGDDEDIAIEAIEFFIQ